MTEIKLCCNWLILQDIKSEVIDAHGSYLNVQISNIKNEINIKLESIYVLENFILLPL